MAKGKFIKWLEPEGILLIQGWARNGLTEDQIAHNIGISRTTLCDWKNRFPDILNAIKKGREIVDIQVENALLKRALGYSYEETRVEIMPDGKKKGVQVTRHVMPDTTAQIFWLKNRRPDIWKNNPVYADQEEYEDDGLMQALSDATADLFADGDDSENVAQEAEE